MKQEPSHKESWYQAKIIKWLKETYPESFIWKAAAGPYSRCGIPDICMVLNGRFYGFEVKRPEVGRLTKIQEITIRAIEAAGGIAGVVSYPEDVERIICIHQLLRRSAAAIGYDRETALKKCRRKRQESDDDVGEEAMALAVKRSKSKAERKEK